MTEEQAKRYRLGFHLAPQQGWLNDPNGLCQFRGSYHAFYQYNPFWPERDTKYWRHAVSPDLVHWTDLGTCLVTDIPEDRSGVYSGSALVLPGEASDGGDLLCLYYTGNVIYPGGQEAGFDYVHTGREANEILVTSEDTRHFSAKHVLLRNEDYPDVCTRHVRDPKVWEQDGLLYMLLGARDLDDEGFCLLYESRDGVEWHIRQQIYSTHPFGYMWECPNIVQLGGRDYLAVCPQGLPSERLRWQNRWQAGYFPLPESILDTVLVDEGSFCEWDAGFDFYAPQTFVDDAGRAILIGWMGTFDHHYTSAPTGLDWCHCLTVARELTPGTDGGLRQWPVAELESLRGEGRVLLQHAAMCLPEYRADVVVQGIQGAGALRLDDALELEWDTGTHELTLRFLDERVSAGRTERTVSCPQLSDLRVLVDSSAVEFYANGGALVFSTRWFPVCDELSLSATFDGASAVVYPLQASVAELWEG